MIDFGHHAERCDDGSADDLDLLAAVIAAQPPASALTSAGRLRRGLAPADRTLSWLLASILESHGATVGAQQVVEAVSDTPPSSPDAGGAWYE